MNSQINLTPAQVDFLKSVIKDFDLETWHIELAGRAASQRYFVRISKNGQSYVLVVWDSHDEDWGRFLSMQKDLRSLVPFLPEIYDSDAARGLILEEDLGTMTLKNFCYENSSTISEIEKAYKKVLDALWNWQQLKISASQSISARAMDFDTFMWESGYFARYCVTEYCACEKMLDKKWDEEREQLAMKTSSLPRTCIHRDFQSENIMIYNGKIRFVDFQGARLGPPQYDTASLLFDPYIEILSPKLTEILFTYYQSISGNANEERSYFNCAAQRLMQALGAYGNLSLHKGKEQYRRFIPLAFDRLIYVLGFLPEYKQIRLIAEVCRETVRKIDTKKNQVYDLCG